MKSRKKHLPTLKHLIANIHVKVSLAKYSKPSPSKWRQLNFVPEFNRFYYIREGEGCLVIDGQTYYPRPGQLFVMPAGVRQSYYAISNNTFGKYWCHFTATIGDANWLQMLNLPYYIDVQDEEGLERLFQKLIRHYREDSVTSALMQRATLLEIIGFYIEGAMKNKSGAFALAASSDAEKIDLLLKYIEQHLHHNITVAELAELVHFHPNYLIRYFREMVGSSPIQYINQLRVEKAKQLLTAGDLPVSEVARAVGLELYYFSRLFKSHTGLSPSGFRRLQRQGD
jgi:AraC-like DNA-binding protein